MCAIRVADVVDDVAPVVPERAAAERDLRHPPGRGGRCAAFGLQDEGLVHAECASSESRSEASTTGATMPAGETPPAASADELVRAGGTSDAEEGRHERGDAAWCRAGTRSGCAAGSIVAMPAARAALDDVVELEQHLDHCDGEQRTEQDREEQAQIAREEATRDDSHRRSLALRTLAGSASIRESLERPILTVGNFDGVHLGHRAILDTVIRTRARLAVAMRSSTPSSRIRARCSIAAGGAPPAHHARAEARAARGARASTP